MTLAAAFSTADRLNGKMAGVPESHRSNWSLKNGDLGSPLSPSGITCRVASQFPGLAIRRMDTFEPTLGVCPLPAIGIEGMTNWPPISGAEASGFGNRACQTFPQTQFAGSGPSRLGSASEARTLASQLQIKSL